MHVCLPGIRLQFESVFPFDFENLVCYSYVFSCRLSVKISGIN
nr:MAG TPA: hypothetical protein [Caudoviricetes sp.]